jgi:hypothetical protein
MKISSGNSRQTILATVLGVLALGAVLYIYEEIFATGTPAPALQAAAVTAPMNPASAPAVRGDTESAAKKAGTTSAALDPTLHMDAMLVSESVEYSGSGRNIFSAASAPPLVAIPQPVAPARPQPNLQAALPPPQPTGPPPLPPIDLKFFGTETSAKGTRLAFLLHDETVYTASAGDIVMRRYRILAVDAKTIQIEDMQNSNKQTLPLLAN